METCLSILSFINCNKRAAVKQFSYKTKQATSAGRTKMTSSRLFSVSVVKGRGCGDMSRPHSLHRSTPNTATARPLCCVWSRKLTGL